MSNNKDFPYSNQPSKPNQFNQPTAKSSYINLFEDKLSKKNSFFEKRKKEINLVKFKSNEEIMNENKVNSFFSSQIPQKKQDFQQIFINFYNEDLTIRHERMVLTDNSNTNIVRSNISNLSIIESIDYNKLTYEEIIDLQKYRNVYKINEIHENSEENQRKSMINSTSQGSITNSNSNSNEKSNFLVKMKNSIIYIMQEVNKDERFTMNDMKKYLFVSFRLPKLIYDTNIESYSLIEIDDSCLLLMKKQGKDSNFKSFCSNSQVSITNLNSNSNNQSSFYIINEKTENQNSQLQEMKNKHMLLKEKLSEKEKEVLFLTSKIENDKRVYNKIIDDEREKLEGVYKEKLILHNKNSLFKFEEMINIRKKEFEDMKNEIILCINTQSQSQTQMTTKSKGNIMNFNDKNGNDNACNAIILNKIDDFNSNFKKNTKF